ncbi:MAG: hypothetical protein ACFFED_03175 [Candidatus Thorarchaeota archaeon]
MTLVKGALIEYSGDFMGPLPNVVLFQFNPESLSREIKIPPRDLNEEVSQAGDAPVETIALTAIFNAASQLDQNNPLAKEFGIGPQLAALEKMVYPEGKIGELILDLMEDVDSFGGEVSGPMAEDERGEPIPRLKFPRILFIWGKTRILPVAIQSMRITEDQFDAALNPISAKVDLSLGVLSGRGVEGDPIATGAMKYTAMLKDAQALANLTNTLAELPNFIAAEVESIIQF